MDDLQLGWDSCAGYLTGDLDDVAIYASALDASQVSDIYENGLAGIPQCGYAPADKAACKNGGWANFGFKNQGQCIRFVNTGKDSR